MMPSIFLALFLPCAGMSVVFLVYMCLLWYAARHLPEITDPVKPVTGNGLSATELEKLPRTTGNELGLVTECAVCLEDIEAEQPVRVVPGCNHGFHLKCADTWLSKNPVCPVCRNKLEPDLFRYSETNPC